MSNGFKIMYSMLKSDAPSLRDGLPERMPDIDPITAISYRDTPALGAESLRCTTETEGIDRLLRQNARGTASWAHLMVAHCARIVRYAITGSPDLAAAVKDLMASCALWLTQIEGRAVSE